MVGILVPFWDGLGLGAMLVSGRVTCPVENGGLEYFPFEMVPFQVTCESSGIF